MKVFKHLVFYALVCAGNSIPLIRRHLDFQENYGVLVENNDKDLEGFRNFIDLDKKDAVYLANTREQKQFVINDINDLGSTRKSLFNNNYSFHERSTGNNYRVKDDKLFKYDAITSQLDVTEVKLTAQGSCMDMTKGPGGSLSHSIEVSGSFDINFDFSVGFQIFFLSFSFGVEFKPAILVAYSTSGSCDIKEGEYGRLVTYLQTAHSPDLLEKEMVLQSGKFVETGNEQIIPGIDFYIDLTPVFQCERSLIPC